MKNDIQFQNKIYKIPYKWFQEIEIMIDNSNSNSNNSNVTKQ
jgi:hypothetical protein